ncbi:DUF116 domain-containing protein [Clostridiaceae bacterium M8S5]|nr:DUF116 domain-containing protein [Clostridiaceae bacterium M8S5]
MKNDRKKFFGVMFFTAILSVVLVVLSIYFLVNKNNNFIKIVIILAIAFFMIVSIFVIFGIIILSRWVYSGNINKKSAMFLKFLLKTIYPVLMMVSKVINIDKATIQRAYCNIHNTLIENLKVKVDGSDILLLLPHCIQNSQCPYKITNDIYNCKMCGKCIVGDIIKLTSAYNMEAVVATGGTLARQWVKKRRPKAIIAVACERDLTSGINDISKIPVYGVFNIIKKTPCHDTSVDIDKLKNAIDMFIKVDN